jgi:hypothetical protein
MQEEILEDPVPTVPAPRILSDANNEDAENVQRDDGQNVSGASSVAVTGDGENDGTEDLDSGQ